MVAGEVAVEEASEVSDLVSVLYTRGLLEVGVLLGQARA